jgi:hypothetical protein
LLEQSAEIIRTDDTFSFWSAPIVLEEVELDGVVDVADEDADLFSTVPVTSILWPTCFLRSLSEPSSTYDVPRADAADVPDVPVVPAVVLVGGGVVGGVAVVPPVDAVVEDDPLPVIAFARMYPPVVEAPAVVAAPLEVAEPACRQPVTVTVFSSVVLLVVDVVPCAASAAVVAHANTAAHTVRFIIPPA